MIIEISVAVIAIAFVALVLFLIKTLRSISELIANTNESIGQLQLQVNEMREETTALIRHADEVAVDVRNKLHSMDPIFYSVKAVGDMVSEVTHSVKQVSASVSRSLSSKAVNSPSSRAVSPAGRTSTDKFSWFSSLLPLALSFLNNRNKAR